LLYCIHSSSFPFSLLFLFLGYAGDNAQKSPAIVAVQSDIYSHRARALFRICDSHKCLTTSPI
jgi:hypothetical protein